MWLVEDAPAMLPVSSIITMTIVDAAGNPLSTLPATDGVYLNSAGLSVGNFALSGMTLLDNGPGAAVDLTTNTPEFSDWNDTSLYVPTDGICDTTGKDGCLDSYNLYESWSWSVTTPSAVVAAEIDIADVNMGRYTAAGAITAYVKLAWAPFPCGTGNAVILVDYPLNFVDCPLESVIPPVYYHEYEYFTYFPKIDGQWWAGLAVTNATLFYDNFVEGWGVDQDIDITMYLIEMDGDMYQYNAGVLPESGILLTLISDPAFAPTALGTDTTFGDEPFWVIVDGTATIPFTFIALDGFGMLGDGNQGQGTLPRIYTAGPFWNSYDKKK